MGRVSGTWKSAVYLDFHSVLQTDNFAAAVDA
jgi:hypothetical protein